RLFATYVEGGCPLDVFRKLATALDRIPLAAIPRLQELYASQPVLPGQHPPRVGEYDGHLVYAGLVNIEFVHTGPRGGPGGYYSKNDLGERFLEIVASRQGI